MKGQVENFLKMVRSEPMRKAAKFSPGKRITGAIVPIAISESADGTAFTDPERVKTVIESDDISPGERDDRRLGLNSGNALKTRLYYEVNNIQVDKLKVLKR